MIVALHSQRVELGIYDLFILSTAFLCYYLSSGHGVGHLKQSRYGKHHSLRSKLEVLGPLITYSRYEAMVAV